MLILTLSLTMFGCDGRLAGRPDIIGDSKMEESNSEAGTVSLEATLSLHNGVLTAEYRIKNKSRVPIYVFNRLWEFGTDGKYAPASQPAYILLGDKGELHLVKGIPAVPKSKRVELKIVPFATKVEAGEELSEKFDLREPISEYNPYFPMDKPDTAELRKTESAYFSIDYVAETEGLEVKPAALENSLSIWHPALAEKVRRLSSQPRASIISVMRRSDSFERF